jgi:GNAT superfamily N-acetyltransferase
MVRVRPARTKDDADAVYRLAYEFVGWLRLRYPEMESEIATYLHHQKFDEQIRDVLIHYNPPKGECLLAFDGTNPVGILMLKDLGEGVCEMNRMFVRESARGLGLGRALVDEIKDRARQMGFQKIILSALPRHHEAITLYRSLGFNDDDRPKGPGNSDKAILMKLDL